MIEKLDWSLFYTVTIFVSYMCMYIYALLYVASQTWKLTKDKNEKIKNHRLEHIKLALLIGVFNVSLILTDINDGIESFIDRIQLMGSPMPMQYLLMTMFLYFAIAHLDEEIKELEVKNE